MKQRFERIGDQIVIIVPEEQIVRGAARAEIAHRIGPDEEAVEVDRKELEEWMKSNLKSESE
jgi:hypothetical protein